jgi:hypothetical protein
MLKSILAGLIVTVVIAGAAVAGPYEDGLAAAKGGDYATTLKLWTPLAEQGNALAQFGLGYVYEHGQGVPHDFVQAAKWYRLAAEQGNADAQLKLGTMYNSGWGVPKTYAEAAKWWQLAADQGLAVAQHHLGGMYYSGKGVPKDYVLAHLWFNLAAAQGIEDAVKARDAVAKLITPDQLGKAQQLAREWKPTTP